MIPVVRCFSIALGILIVLSAPCFAASEPAGAGTEDERPANPHFKESGCSVCHKGGRHEPISHGMQEDLCLSCHKDQKMRSELHPTQLHSVSRTVKDVPAEFPLAFGTLGCSTCHDIRIQCRVGEAGRHHNRAFLRGGPYVPAYGVCFRCHNREYYEVFNPHDQLTAEGRTRIDTCNYCHEKSSSPNARTAKVGPCDEAVCRDCHKDILHGTGSRHMQNSNAKMRAQIRRIEREKQIHLPLSPKNQIFCGTCHNPHEKGVFPQGDVRAIGAEQGAGAVHARVRVTETLICTLCHSTTRQE